MKTIHWKTMRPHLRRVSSVEWDHFDPPGSSIVTPQMRMLDWGANTASPRGAPDSVAQRAVKNEATEMVIGADPFGARAHQRVTPSAMPSGINTGRASARCCSRSNQFVRRAKGSNPSTRGASATKFDSALMS